MHRSPSIEREFVRVWARLFPAKAEQGSKILATMRGAIPGWRATESRKVLKTASLPDPDDRHVLAAAVGVGAAVIVTHNTKDFPASALEAWGVVAKTPDQVLCDVFDDDPEAFLEACRAMRARLKAPPMSPQEWLDGIAKGGCAGLSAKLRQHMQEI